MNYFFMFPFVLTVACFLYLVIRANRAAQEMPVTADDDAAKLVAIYRQSLQADPERQEELDYRLYHSLKAHRSQRRQEQGALPLWSYPALLGVLLAAGYLWYARSGQYFQAWSNVVQPLEPALIRSQFLGDLEPLKTANPTIYCQALQQRIDHKSRSQLDTLGRCFSAYNDFPAASEVYKRLYLLFPEDRDAAFNYAQTTLFSQPDRTLPPDIEKILLQQADENPVAKILLATSYSQGKNKARAEQLWAQLRHELPPDHPLYDLIPRAESAAALPSNHPPLVLKKPAPAATEANGDFAITVNIDPELLRDLPTSARLFVTAAKTGERRPIAVQAVPPAATQVIHLNDSNSMTGEALSPESAVTIRAILSASGKVAGERLAEAESEAAPNAPLTLHLTAPK